MLITAGALVNATDNYKNTPLHFAVSNCHSKYNIDAIKLLLKNGALINCININEETPLSLAILQVHYNKPEEIVKLLIKNKADEGDSSWLCRAIECRDEEFVLKMMEIYHKNNISLDYNVINVIVNSQNSNYITTAIQNYPNYNWKNEINDYDTNLFLTIENLLNQTGNSVSLDNDASTIIGIANNGEYD